MLASEAKVNERQVDAKTWILDIQGEVNAAAETPLMNAYSQANAGGARVVILNFNGLKYMNSTGIGLLVTLLIRTSRQQQHLMAYGLNEHYQQIFKLTRLDDAIALFETEAQAVQAAGAVRS